MKKSVIAIIILVSFLSGGGGVILYDRIFHSHGPERTEEKQQYTCPMHPQIISDKPGKCPICGMDLVPIKKEDKEAAPAGKDADAGRGADGKPAGPADLAAIYVPEKTASLLGVMYEPVKMKDLAREIRTSAVIVADETRIHKVTTKIGGWIEQLYVNQTGQAVKKGDPLFTIYSQELLAAQQEYLSTVNAETKLAGSSLKDTLKSLRESARERLKLLDVTDAQIAAIEKSGVPQRNVTVYSPASGFVVEKMVTAGQKLMMNDPAFVISDLSRIWAEADIYQPDLPFVRVGSPVKLTLSYWPGKVFNGRVTFIAPVVNPETRTLKARIEVANTDLTLKPQMFADATLSHAVGRKPAVPESAVFRTGTKEYVFVKDKGGHIRPVIVKTGFRSGDGYFELLAGPKAGEMVVSSANFLIDSESSIKAALQAATGTGAGASTAPTGHEGHGK